MTASTYRDRVAAHLREHAGEWVDGLELAQIGGAYGWRTRISQARTQLGMDIKNRQRRVGDGRVVSEYRFVPRDLLWHGGEA